MATVTPYKRDLPFIHRAWKNTVDSISQYGRKLTTANGDSPVNGDDGPRMVKRRRLDGDSLESALDSAIDHFLPDSMDDFEKVFRVQVLKVIRNGTPAFQAETLLNIAKSPAKKDTPSIRIRCRLTIYWYKDRGHKQYRALYSDNQICNIKVFQDEDGPAPMARIYLANPFHIPAEKIYVERDDAKGFGLDDCYMIGIELESAGDPRWPPQDLLPKPDSRDGTSDRRQHWVLSTQFFYRFDKHRWTSPVKLRKRPGEDLPTEYRMDTDLRWSTGSAAGAKAKLGLEDSPPDIKSFNMNGALEPLTNGHVNGRVEHLANGYVKDVQDVLMDDDDEPEEATTPSRSLRHREKQNYNLKLLSDKARGKERKEQERKERKRRKAAEAEIRAGHVTWILPHTGRVVLEKFACLRCFAEHYSMSQLKDHLEVHTDYKHSYPPGGNFVVISAHDEVTPRISKSYLLDPQSIDDHESDLEEQTSPAKTRRSHSRSKTSQPMAPPRPRDTKLLIPNNKQPIYDPLSKQVLEPGSRVDPPQVDISWLLQKHRDIIRDYSDLHPDEKEFITEWDSFVIHEGVTTEPHLQEVYLDFVQQKASWLLAYQSRMTEFAKHLTYLTARNALTEETVAKALDTLREARSQRRPDQPEPAKAPSPKVGRRKSTSGCAVCGQSVRGPSTLVCTNPECTRPLFHDDCIRGGAAMPIESRKWRCNECCVAEQEAADEKGPAIQPDCQEPSTSKD